MLQNSQAKEHDAEMNFPSKRMSLSFREGHDRLADQAAETLLILQIPEANCIEMALKELKYARMWRERVLGLLLFSQHQGLVGW